MMRARAGPSPKTVWVALAKSGQSVQPAARRLSASIDLPDLCVFALGECRLEETGTVDLPWRDAGRLG
jgi:hypothetical protein